MLQQRMTYLGGLTAVLLATCAVAAGEHEPKCDAPVGDWKLKCVSPDGKSRQCVVSVFGSGTTLGAKYIAEGVAKPVKAVSFQKGVLSFRVDGNFAGQTYGLTYSGRPRGDDLQGTVRWSYGWATGTFAFEGERIAQKVAANP